MTLPDNARILLIKPSSLGDIVHALPALSALRQRYPQAWITWLVKEEWAELLNGHPALNDVWPFSFRLADWPSFLKRIRSVAFDVTIDLQGLFRSGIISKLSGAMTRIGFAGGREGSPFFYTHGIELPIPADKSWRLLDMHAVDRNLFLIEQLGADVSHPRFVLPVSEQDQKSSLSLLTSHGWSLEDRLIGIAPMTRAKVKNWPLERFVETARVLCQAGYCRVVVLGSSDQREIGSRFEHALGQSCINLVGKTTLRQLTALMHRMTVVLANDSAAAHLAAAVGTPVVAVMGPTNPRSTGPYGKCSRVAVCEGLACRPCGARTCQNSRYLECMTGVSVEQVVAQTEPFLLQAGQIS